MIVLGIDPGTRVTGFGVVKILRDSPHYVASGCITIGKAHASSIPNRLKQLFDDLSLIIAKYAPQQISIEKVFVHKNVSSALKLGQARGALMVAAASLGFDVHEYSPRQIKKAISGYGDADKLQMRKMVSTLLGLSNLLGSDAADALAVAICHSNYVKFNLRTLK